MAQTNNRNPHSRSNGFAHQTNPQKHQQTHGDVVQDKARIFRARTASPQPASPKKEQRAHSLDTDPPRSQNNAVPKAKAVQVTLWVKPRVKAELQRIAAQEGVSISTVGGAFLETALQQRADLHYGALLEPIIARCIAREMKGISTRLAWLLVRVAFDTGQVRGMVTNILGRQTGMNQEILIKILTESSNTAKANIIRRTPQLAELMGVLETWLQDREKE